MAVSEGKERMRKRIRPIRKDAGEIHTPSLVLGVAAAVLIIGLSFWCGTLMNGKSKSASSANLPAISNTAGGVEKGKQLLTLAENTISDIASDASKSIVNIDIRKTVTVPSFEQVMPGFGLGERGLGQKFQQQGSGSGVVFRKDGYILTNNHVVGAADEIKVTLDDGRKFSGKVVGRDRFTDLALVKIDATNLSVAKLGTSKSLRPGDWAIAIGSPMGLDHTVTLGIISAMGRSLTDLHDVDLIQTDAAINPGNSGGPLLNIHGEVIGLNTAIRGDAQNIGFAIPVDICQSVAEQLLESGRIARAYVGIYMQELDPQLSRSLGLPEETKGVAVAGIAPDGPADQSDLKPGDVIQRVDGKPVEDGKQVQSLVAKHKPGEILNFLVLREGNIKPVDLKVGDYPDNTRKRAEPESE